MRNQKEFSLLNNDQKAALSGLGTSVSGPLQQAAQSHRTAASGTGPMLSTGREPLSPSPQRSRWNCNCRRFRTRYPKCICSGSHHPHPTVIYGWRYVHTIKSPNTPKNWPVSNITRVCREVILSTDQAFTGRLFPLVNKKNSRKVT